MKKDIKYIIKRIIIGVGIALILGFLGKKGVLAATAQDYCFSSSTSLSVVECSSDILNNYHDNYNLSIKNTPVGLNSFTFYYDNDMYSYTFGFENLQNHDILLIYSTVYKSFVDNNNFQYFGISPNGQDSFVFHSLEDFNNNWARGGYIVVYITEESARGLDIYNSNIFMTSDSQNYNKTMSSVNDYTFITGYFNSSFDFQNYFNSLSSYWVMNQLNGSPVFSNFDSNLYILSLDNENQPISSSTNLQLSEESNNFQLNFQDYWQQGFDSGGDDFINNSCSDGGLCATNITGYIDLLKMPFNFIKGLSKDKCQPLNVPIPFVGGNIQINCLSSTFENVLGNLSSIILYIITGLYAYRITILNIDTITDVLNPQDDKLEVVDL